MKLLAASILAVAALWTSANATAPPAHVHAAATAAAVAPAWTPGEITKIDLERSRLTLAHGRIEHLKMDAMTMPFGVKDPAFLTRFKVGDRVQFKADRVDGRYVVVEIRAAK